MDQTGCGEWKTPAHGYVTRPQPAEHVAPRSGVGGALRGGSGLGTGGLREKVLRITPHLVGARVTA